MLVHLKTRRGIEPQRHGVLLDPIAPMRCDADLAEAVKRHGHATIGEIAYSPDVHVATCYSMRAADFNQDWQGD